MLNDIPAPLSPEHFFRNHRTRQLLHVPGRPDKFRYLFPWDVLNKTLEEHRFNPKLLVLFKFGRKIELGRYLDGYRVDTARLVHELSNGCTLVLNSCEEVHRPRTDLGIDLGRLFHRNVTVNLYCGWRRDKGFDVHWDDHNAIVLQVAGRKRWKVWNPTRQHPFSDDIVDTTLPPKEEPVWDGTLEPGGLLSIPRGWWHVACPMDEPCLHLTVTVKSPTGIDLLRWLADGMKSGCAPRIDVPVTATPVERAEWLEGVRPDLMAAWEGNPIDVYLADLDAKIVARLRISLHGEVGASSNGLRRTTLLKLAAPRPLQFTIRDDGAFCHAGGMRWQMDAGIAEKLGRFNDRQTHSISEISPVADLRLTALIGALIINGILRRVANAQS